MKKFNILMMGLVALGMASCEEGPSVTPPQSNPQGPVLEATNWVGQAAGPIVSGKLDLESYVSNPAIEVYKVESIQNLPDGAEPMLKYVVSATPDFKDSKTLDVTVTEGVGTVNANELNATHVQLFGKSPKAKEVSYRIEGYIVSGGTEYRIGGPEYYVAEGKYSETCMDMGFVIEDAYYFLSNATTWDMGAANIADYKMEHSDADVYDDPVFSIVVESEAGDNWWKIAPQSAIDNEDWGKVLGPATNGDTATEGKLVDAGAEAGLIAEPGKYRITVNMETLDYTIVKITRPEYLCTPGGSNSWNQGASQWMAYSEGKGYFCGALLLNDGFKMTDGATWADDKTWGLGAEPGTLTQPGDNLPVPAAGLYWAVADLDALTYSITPIWSVGVVGSMNGWAADAPAELTPNDAQSVWTGEVTFGADEIWKIIINHSWDSNYGAGTLELPVFDAGNFSGVAAGTYTVTVDFNGNYPMISLIAK